MTTRSNKRKVNSPSQTSNFTDIKSIRKGPHSFPADFADFMNASHDLLSYWEMPDGLRTDLPMQKQIDMFYESVCLDLNRHSWEGYGLQSKDQAVGKRYIELVGERTLDEAFAVMIANNYQLFNYEIREIDRKGNEHSYIVDWYSVIENGAVVNLWVYGRDITEQKLVEKDLRETQIHFTKFMDTSQDIVTYWKAPDGHKTDLPIKKQLDMLYELVCVDANKAAWQTAGFKSKKDMIGKKYIDMVQEKTVDEALKRFIKNNYQLENHETFQIFRNGKSYYRLASWHGIVENGVLTHAWTISKDITDRKQAEEALKRSEDNYRSLVSNIPAVVWRSNSQGQTIYISPKVKDIYGYTAEEIYEGGEQLWFGRIHPEDVDRVKGEYSSFLSKAKEFQIEYRIRRKDGEWIWIRDSGTKVDIDEETVYAEGFFVDITEKKNAEAAITEKTKFLDRIVESSALSLWISDENGMAIRANPACFEFFGAKEQEVIGKYNLFKDEVIEKQGFMPTIKRVFEKGEPAAFVIDYDFADTGHVDVEKATHKIVKSIFTPIMDNDGIVSNVIVQSIDLTDIMKTEELLREQRDKAQQYLDIAGVMFVALNDEGIVTLINNKGCEILGYDEHEIVGKNWFVNFLPKELGEEVFAVFKQLMAGDIDHTEYFENPVMCKDGNVRTIAWHNNLIRDNSGRTIGTLSSGEDITERKQAEEALRQSEARYKSLIDFADEGIFILQDNVFKFINPKIEELFGYKRKDIENKPFIDFVYEDDREMIIDRHIRRLAGEQLAHRCPFRIYTRNKDIKWVEINATLIDWDEKPAVLVLLTDITERTLAEQALLESEERFRSLFNNAVDGMLLLDENGTFVDCNNKAAELYGHSKEAVLSMKPWEFSPPLQPDGRDSVEKASEMIKGAFDGNPQLFEWVHVKEDGSPVDVEIHLSRIEISGNMVVLAIARDISERKIIQKSIKQLSEAVGQSIDGISMTDDKNKIIFTNYAFADMHGYHPTELLGSRLKELHVSSTEYDMVKNALQKEGSWAGEAIHLKKDGTRFPVYLSVTVLRGNNNEFMGFVETCRDITAEKLAQESIRESEEKYRATFERSRDAIYVFAPDRNFLDANKKFLELTGYTRAELNILDASKIYPAAETEEAKQRLTALMQGDSIPIFETTLIRKTGEVVPVEVAVNTIRGAYGRDIVLQGNIRDITVRKQAEEEIKRIARFPSENPNPVMRASGEGVVLYANKASAPLLKHWGSKTGEKLPPKCLEHLSKVLKSNVPADFETEYNGTVMLLTLAPVSELNQVNMYGLDITEAKQAEEKIKLAAEEWRTTFDSINDMISIHDKDCKLVRVNKAFADTFKVDPQKLIGKACYKLIHNTNECISGCPHMKTLKTNKSSTSEFFEPNLGIHMEVATSPIFDDGGDVIASVHVARDITERKNMQEQLILTDRLSSVGELASGIAHEINNPLTSIIGFSDMILEETVPDGIKKDLQIINEEARRASGVVRNLLTFARKHPKEKIPVKVNEVLQKVLDLRQYEHKLNNISIETHLEDNLPEVTADPFQLQQVFLNIIINAEFFMSQAHGRGTLSIASTCDKKAVKIVFTDDGPGIPEHALDHLFDPFFTTKDVGKGTGLGLSISYGIVQEHNGTIHAESKKGDGASFIVELPIQKSEK